MPKLVQNLPKTVQKPIFCRIITSPKKLFYHTKTVPKPYQTVLKPIFYRTKPIFIHKKPLFNKIKTVSKAILLLSNTEQNCPKTGQKWNLTVPKSIFIRKKAAPKHYKNRYFAVFNRNITISSKPVRTKTGPKPIQNRSKTCPTIFQNRTKNGYLTVQKPVHNRYLTLP